MFLNLSDFNFMFPNYYEFRTPMWSEWEEKGDELLLKVAVPGYEKEDFELFIEDSGLFLKINSGKKDQLLYSILGKITSGYELEGAVSEYRNGILKVTIPRIPKKKPKQIAIKVS